MFGLSTKLPISQEMQIWADQGFVRLEAMLGRTRMVEAEMVLPDDRFFPDPYDGSKAAVVAMAERVANFMGVDRGFFAVEIYAEGEAAWRATVPLWHGETQDAAGLYFHEPQDGRRIAGINADQLGDPVSLVATLAHELAHVLLLGGGLLDREAGDMEPMTDLCTVYLGMGYFTASAAYRFKQWTDPSTQGWSTSRKGYLPETLWGYALARFAAERGERKPAWANGLPKNVQVYFAQSAKWIAKDAAVLG